MFTLKIETELGETFQYTDEPIEIAKIVSEWLLTSDSGETPINSMEITPAD